MAPRRWAARIASVGGLMSQRNIAIRIVSPGPAVSKSRLGRSSTVGSDVTVGGEVKQTSTPACAWHPLLPATLPAVSAGRALAGAPGVVTASRGVARQSDAAARRRLRMRTDDLP